MTPLTSQELSLLAFGHTVSAAQEGSIPGSNPNNLSLEAFLDIVPRAQDGSQTSGLISAMRYGDNGGSATFTRNKFKVKPSMSDFVIDVQNISRKFLSSQEHKYFMETYFVQYLGIADEHDNVDLTADGKDKFMEQYLTQFAPTIREQIRTFDSHIRAKLGAAFIETGLFPFNEYMNQGDFDIRKRYEN